MKTEDDFLEWLSGADIYIGWDRYGQFGPRGFVVATKYDENDQLNEDIENIGCPGDNDAIDSGMRIKSDPDCWYATDKNPAVAMAELVEKMRRFYFCDLNKRE